LRDFFSQVRRSSADSVGPLMSRITLTTPRPKFNVGRVGGGPAKGQNVRKSGVLSRLLSLTSLNTGVGGGGPVSLIVVT
jgi:hypothetical protein